MVTDIKAENDLVQLCVLNSDSQVAQRWWQLPKELWQAHCSHVELSHWVELSPCVLESLDVLFLQCKNVVFVLSSLVVIKAFTNDCNKDIHEDEEGSQLEHNPEDYGDSTLLGVAVMHYSIPRLTRRCSPKGHEAQIEGLEVNVVVDKISIWHGSEKRHSSNCKGKKDQEQQQGCVNDVLN